MRLLILDAVLVALVAATLAAGLIETTPPARAGDDDPPAGRLTFTAFVPPQP